MTPDNPDTNAPAATPATGAQEVTPPRKRRTIDSKGDYLEGFTTDYYAYNQVARAFGITRTQLQRLETAGALMPPAVLVATDTYGWDRAAVDQHRDAAFAEHQQHLDAVRNFKHPEHELTPGQVAIGDESESRFIILREYGLQHAVGDAVPKPALYYGTSVASMVYGFAHHGVYLIRNRHATRGRIPFIPADVRIGDRFGWGEQRLVEYGRKVGRFNTEKAAVWAVRRTRELGITDRPRWLAELLAEQPELQTAIDRALDDWYTLATDLDAPRVVDSLRMSKMYWRTIDALPASVRAHYRACLHLRTEQDTIQTKLTNARSKAATSVESLTRHEHDTDFDNPDRSRILGRARQIATSAANAVDREEKRAYESARTYRKALQEWERMRSTHRP